MSAVVGVAVPAAVFSRAHRAFFLGGFSSLLYRLDAELNAEAAEVASLYSKLDKAAAYCASAVKQRTCTLCSRMLALALLSTLSWNSLII